MRKSIFLVMMLNIFSFIMIFMTRCNFGPKEPKIWMDQNIVNINKNEAYATSISFGRIEKAIEIDITNSK